MNEEKNTSFFKKMLISIKDFDKYTELAASNINKTMSYIMKLNEIFTIVISIIAVYKISKQINNIYDYIENSIGEISYKDGKLKISEDEPIVIDNEEAIFNKVIIDTGNLQKEKQDEYLKQMINNNFLTSQELELVKRARNHKSHKCPKNTDVVTYKNATGIEALIGYLYLKEDIERMNQVMNFIVGD